jgi:hypothetical protein
MDCALGCRAKLGAALMTCVATGSRDQHELREKLGYAGQLDGAGGFAGEIVMCSFSPQPTARTASTAIAPRVLISDRPAPILPVDLSLREQTGQQIGVCSPTIRTPAGREPFQASVSLVRTMRLRRKRDREPRPVADVYVGLRQQVLRLTPDQLGNRVPTDAPILALLMETAYPEAVATLVAVADGSASLYFSNGGGGDRRRRASLRG